MDKNSFALKGVKYGGGMEGPSYCATVYIDGVKAFTAVDEGRGGEVMIFPINKILTQKAEEFAKTLPPYSFSYDGKTDYIDYDLELLVGDLVNEYLKKDDEKKQERKWRKQCETKTLYFLKDSGTNTYWISPNTYGPNVKSFLQRKYGDNLGEIINERYL